MTPTDPESAYTRATAPILGPEHTYASVTDKISAIVLVRPYGWRWFLGLGIGLALTLLLVVSIVVLLYNGVGIWGIDVPVMWGFAIVNFVWWIGIGHAGTLISAILLLLKQDWRTSINRFAEAMTLFAVACAGLFPLLHLGRPWLFYWLMPYPNTMGALAAVAQPIDLGRVCRVDVCDGFTVVLVRRAHSRPGDPARSLQESLGSIYLRNLGDGLARFGPALASLSNNVPADGRSGDPAGRLRTHDCGTRLHRGDHTWLAQRRFSRRISWRGPSSRDSPWWSP